LNSSRWRKSAVGNDWLRLVILALSFFLGFGVEIHINIDHLRRGDHPASAHRLDALNFMPLRPSTAPP